MAVSPLFFSNYFLYTGFRLFISMGIQMLFRVDLAKPFTIRRGSFQKNNHVGMSDYQLIIHLFIQHSHYIMPHLTHHILIISFSNSIRGAVPSAADSLAQDYIQSHKREGP